MRCENHHKHCGKICGNAAELHALQKAVPEPMGASLREACAASVAGLLRLRALGEAI